MGVFDLKVSADKAREFCKKEGADLASVESIEE